MLLRRPMVLILVIALASLVGVQLAIPTVAQKLSVAPAIGRALTVDRVYSQPSLSGRLTRGPAWAPDGKQLSYFETKGSGKEAKTELWVMDAASGERRLLVSSDKLESILPAENSKTTQATGLGRRAPSQYQWAPDGGGILFQGATALAWLDMKSQAARTLVSGTANIADPKISPDGRFVSFVRDHNLWLVSVANGNERAATQGGAEEIRKGELDLLIADASTGSSHVALTEKDPYWINVSDDLFFLKDGKRFLWSSERSGYRHLYLYDVGGKQLAQLTKGDWEVAEVDAVDEAKDLVYFTATEKSPMERQLYRVALDGSSFTRLTKEGGTHAAVFAANASAFIDTFSNTAARSEERRVGKE